MAHGTSFLASVRRPELVPWRRRRRAPGSQVAVDDGPNYDSATARTLQPNGGKSYLRRMVAIVVLTIARGSGNGARDRGRAGTDLQRNHGNLTCVFTCAAKPCGGFHLPSSGPWGGTAGPGRLAKTASTAGSFRLRPVHHSGVRLRRRRRRDPRQAVEARLKPPVDEDYGGRADLAIVAARRRRRRRPHRSSWTPVQPDGAGLIWVPRLLRAPPWRRPGR